AAEIERTFKEEKTTFASHKINIVENDLNSVPETARPNHPQGSAKHVATCSFLLPKDIPYFVNDYKNGIIFNT
ncbi:hypothetical protein L9F63_020783, partial [Diploptera punctata]